MKNPPNDRPAVPCARPHTAGPRARLGGELQLLATLVLLTAISVGCGESSAGPGQTATQADAATTGDSSAADTSISTGNACKADADCPAAGSPCALRRCLAGSCAVIDLEGLPCDDGQVCTVGDTCKAGTCEAGADLCACRVDPDCVGKTDLCHGTPTCDTTTFPYQCRGGSLAPVFCPEDGNPCTVEACDSSTGGCSSKPTNTGLGCSDDDPCTTGDVCSKGSCMGGVSTCACSTTADCAKFDDADACNGSQYCDKAAFPYACKVNPASVVVCNTAKDGPCAKASCAPKTGQCSVMPIAEGGDCTAKGACDQASCKSGACTPTGTDICACTQDKDCLKDEDGDLCNGTLYCELSSGSCKVNPATKVTCPSVADNACIKNTCLPTTGACQLTAVEWLDETCAGVDKADCSWALKKPGAAAKPVACDDGDACTTGDVCAKGVCSKGATNTCACTKDGDCAKLEDGNLCNGTLFCNQQVAQCQLNPATTVSCPSAQDSDCVKNACIAKTGKCVPTHVELVDTICLTLSTGGLQCRTEVQASADPKKKNLPCDDGDKCVASTTCKAGSCQGGKDLCKCSADADCAAQDDGNLCNGLPYCDKTSGLCKPNSAKTVVCKTVDNTACMKLACHSQSGQCIPTAAKEAKQVCNADKSECRWEVKAPTEPMPLVGCDNGDPCTTNDTCVGGLCQAGKLICECSNDSDCDTKDDGNKCNGVWYCDKTAGKRKCVFNPDSVVVCGQQPSNICTKKACDPKVGACALVAANDGKSCDDGEPCTEKDACATGSCQGSKNLCDDQDLCTQDACIPGKGCTYSKANCADGNACSIDLCDAKTGKCSFDLKSLNGKGCDADGDPCTPTDVCSEGKCLGGQPIVCKLPAGACEKAMCAPNKGNGGFQCVVVAKVDGEPCADGTGCTVGALCKGGSCEAGGKERLMHVARGVAKWQSRLAATAALPQGHALAVGRSWQGSESSPTASAWWIARYDRAGAPQLTPLKFGGKAAGQAFTVLSSEPDPWAGAWAVGLREDGDAVVAGAMRAASVGLNARVTRLNPSTGTVVWSQEVGAKGIDEVARAVVVQPGGAVMVAGWQRVGTGARTPWAARLTAAGAFEWQSTPWLGNGEVLGAVPAAGGAAVFAGRVGTGAGAKGRLVLALATGKSGGLDATLTAAGGVELLSLAATTDGWLVAGRTTVAANNTPRALWARVDTDGKQRWLRTATVHGDATAITALGKGWLLGGTTNPSGGNDDAWLAAIDDRGNQQWQRSMDGGGGDAALALAVATDGDVLVVGRRGGTQAEESGLFARVDQFGHSSCGAAGTCLAMKADECNDKLVCTADDCHGSQGCTHTGVDAFTCDPADGCSIDGVCSKGACEPAKTGKLYVKTHPHAPEWRYSGLIALKDGGLATLGEQDDYSGSQPRKVWLVKLTDAGEPVSATVAYTHTGVATGISGVRGTALMERADGGFVVGIDRGDALGQSSGPRLLGLSAAGKEQWKKTPPYNVCTSGHIVRIAGYPGGDVLDVRACPGGYGGRITSLVVRRKSSGDAVWSESGVGRYYVAGADVGLSDGLIVGNDTAWVVGAIWGGVPEEDAKHNAHAAALDGSGKRLWQRVYAERAASAFTALAASSAGELVAAGWRTHNNVRRTWMVALSGKGDVLWQRSTSVGPTTLPSSLVALKDGAFMLSGLQRQGLLDQTWLARLSAKGELERAQIIQVGLLAQPAKHGLVALPDDTVALAGFANVAGKPVGLIARADRWGHVGCAASAGCLLKTQKMCTDGEPCTTDTCVAGKCAHSAAPCSDGDVCTADACATGKGCTHGSASCDDGDACTSDVCDALEGCVHLAIPGCSAVNPCATPKCDATKCDGVVMGGQCYAANLAGFGNRSKALASCQATGRTLLSIHDAATNVLAMDMAATILGSASASVWTGLYKANKLKAWEWLDGSPVDYSGATGYKLLPPTAGYGDALGVRIEVTTNLSSSGTWIWGSLDTNSSCVPVCIGMPKASCTQVPVADGTQCSTGKTCVAGACK